MLPSHPLFSAWRILAYTCINVLHKQEIKFSLLFFLSLEGLFKIPPDFLDTCQRPSSLPISSRCRLLEFDCESSWPLSVGGLLMAPPQIHSRFNLSCFFFSSCCFLCFLNICNFSLQESDFARKIYFWPHSVLCRALLLLLVFYLSAQCKILAELAEQLFEPALSSGSSLGHLTWHLLFSRTYENTGKFQEACKQRVVPGLLYLVLAHHKGLPVRVVGWRIRWTWPFVGFNKDDGERKQWKLIISLISQTVLFKITFSDLISAQLS